MTIDGFSVANLGLYRPATPSEVAHQAEKMADEQAEVVIKEVDDIGEVDPDGKKEKDRENEQENNREENGEKEKPEIVLDPNMDLKKFKVKFNTDTNLVELVDLVTGGVIETIKPNDLVNLMSKSKNPSGILVDKAI